MYPVKVPMFRWKTHNLCQIICRPDALASVCADLLLLHPAGKVCVGSVEHEGSQVLSFLVSYELPHISMKANLVAAIDPYRTMP